jgi:selenocysteine lyase/cysteine desulfurase
MTTRSRLLAGVPGVVVLGPGPTGGAALPLVAFTVTGMPHALVAARLSAEHGIGVRHGCFCAHPYLIRLLGLGPDEIARHWDAVRRGDRREMPGAVRASAGISTSIAEIDRLVTAVADIASGRPPPSPTTRTRAPVISISRTAPPGPAPSAPSAPPAPGVER